MAHAAIAMYRHILGVSVEAAGQNGRHRFLPGTCRPPRRCPSQPRARALVSISASRSHTVGRSPPRPFCASSGARCGALLLLLHTMLWSPHRDTAGSVLRLCLVVCGTFLLLHRADAQPSSGPRSPPPALFSASANGVSVNVAARESLVGPGLATIGPFNISSTISPVQARASPRLAPPA